MHSNVFVIGILMVPIEEALRDTFVPAIFGEEDIDTGFRKIFSHSVNCGSLGIPDPRSSAYSAYNTYKASSKELIGSLLGGNALKYLGHRACVRRASTGARK